ncbi:hypothetical protein [Nocardiopsis synnemataformans]|uniref:hypothetical protein n=1 Tax=Nocardiopsis synnemataformans TaxID=61305 RepID=UPI003EB9E38E
MAVVWANSFDGTPGTSVTVANSAAYGDPIAGIRNNAPANAVRYGDQAVMGRSSLRLGTDTGSPHGDVWLYNPAAAVNAYSISFYLLLRQGTWYRVRDANVITEFYLATESRQYLLGTHAIPAAVIEDNVVGNWVRVEISATLERMAYRLYWTDIHGQGAPDYEYSEQRAAGSTVGQLYTQGAGISSAPTPYVDQIRVGEGEWLGPWPTHHQLSAAGVLPLAGTADVTADLAPGTIVAEGTLAVAGAATLSRHATVSAAGALAVESGDAGVVRNALLPVSATLPLAAPPVEIAASRPPTFPPLLTVELGVDGEWVPVTGDVRVSEDLLIRRGRADEAARADPSSLSLLLNNRHGRYSPRNPLSPYYGLIGRNTPVRVRAADLPDPGVTLVRDSFDRATTETWGTADTGQTWVRSSGGPDDFWTTPGAGYMKADSVAVNVRTITTNTIPGDMDVTWSFQLSELPTGALSGATYCNLGLRHQEGLDALYVGVAVRAFSGSPDGRCYVSGDVRQRLGGQDTQLTPPDTIAPVSYAVGEWVRCRLLAVGPEVKLKVWADGDLEPEPWLGQAYTTAITGPGPISFGGFVTAGADTTPMPTVVAVRDLTIRTPVPEDTGVRFVGEISSWPPRWDLSDSDVWVPIQASGIGRRLGQGAKPLQSSLRRGIPGYRPLAYWPLEDGQLSTQAAEVTGHTGPLTTSGLTYAEDDTLISSGPLPKVRPGARLLSGPIPSVDSGAWEVDMLFRLEEATESTTDQMLLDVTTSTMRAWVITRRWTDGRPIMVLNIRDLDGAELATPASFYIDATQPPVVLGQWNRLRLRSYTTGSECTTEAQVLDLSRSTGAYRGGWRTYTHGPGVGSPARIDTRFGTELGDLSIGHITVWGSHLATAYFLAGNGYAGETAADRLSRLSVGEQVPVLVVGDADTELGPEPEGTFLDGVGAAMDADLGVPGEPRDALGLLYRARKDLYNRQPVITLDYTAGHISDPVEPVDDDQQLRNDIEVKRDHGSSFHVVDEDGPLGVNTVGRYDESVTLSLASDGQLADQAGWRLHLGTVDELRWPTIRVNLANPRMREHIPALLGLDAGDRIRILNPPHWTQAQDLDLIVQGYEERIGAFAWDLTLTCTPASAWTVGVVAESAPAEVDPSAPDRADTSGSVLAFDIDQEETHLPVSTTSGPPWTTSAEDCPFDITCGGEVMRVTQVVGDGSTGFPQSLICQRSVNGIVKPHAAGTGVRLAQPAIVAL